MQHDGGVEETGEGGLPRPSLARLLDEEGVASRGEVEDALAEGAQTGERLGEVLLRRAVVDESKLAQLLARQWRLPFADEGELEPEPSALLQLPADQARELGAVPVAWEEGVLRVVVAEPTDERIGEVRRRLGREARFVVVAASVLERLLARAEVSGTETDAGGAPGVGPSVAVIAELVGELDQGTARVLAVRGRLEQLAAALVEREQALARSEAELADARRVRDSDRNVIGQFQRELDELRRVRMQDQDALDKLRSELERRQELLASLRAQLTEMTNAFGRFGLA
jgi:hypothetical protein